MNTTRAVLNKTISIRGMTDKVRLLSPDLQLRMVAKREGRSPCDKTPGPVGAKPRRRPWRRGVVVCGLPPRVVMFVSTRYAKTLKQQRAGAMCTSENTKPAKFAECGIGEVRRTPLLGTSVNSRARRRAEGFTTPSP